MPVINTNDLKASPFGVIGEHFFRGARPPQGLCFLLFKND